MAGASGDERLEDLRHRSLAMPLSFSLKHRTSDAAPVRCWVTHALGGIDVTDFPQKMSYRVLISVACVAAALLMASCASAPQSQAERVPGKVLWIPMDADASDGALNVKGLLAFSTGSVELSGSELAAIAADLLSSNSVAESRENISRYRNNVRLIVLSDEDITLISDGCRLVDLETRTSIELPQRLVDAINAKPPASKRWACRG